MARGRVDVARSVETGLVLAALVVVLLVTGLLLSPTFTAVLPLLDGVQATLANPLYVTHVAAGVMLAAFVLWHLRPFEHQLGRKPTVPRAMRVASTALLALVAVEVATGLVLWARWYFVLGKATAVYVHLLAAFLVLVPFALHFARGLGVREERRGAAARALSAADEAGRGAQAREARAGVTRRAFLRLAAYAAAGVALAAAIGTYTREQVMRWRVNSVGAIPALTKEDWTLRVTGLVGKPIEITFPELLALPQRTHTFTHRCVEGWTYTDTFTGVPLRHVLDAAGGVLPDAKQLVFRSPEVSTQVRGRGESYSSNFPVEDGLHDDVLLVFAVDGEDLPPEHGFPVRLMTPRKWGYKACKWLTEVHVTADASYRGYWEKRGYQNDGDWPGPIFG